LEILYGARNCREVVHVQDVSAIERFEARIGAARDHSPRRIDPDRGR
jgi:hypothetical protein